MAIRSYIDLTLLIRILSVGPGTSADNIRLRSRPLNDGELVSTAVRAFTDRRRATVFHERYHYWQGLSLPYLVRQAALTREAAFRAFRSLAANQADFHVWSASPPEVADLSHRILVWENSRHLLQFSEEQDCRGLPEDAPQGTRLSIVDLVEGAASIAEWQVTAAPQNTQPDATDFRRWLVRVPAYTRAYEFASRVLRDDTIALRSILPLICASLRTTKPLLAFLTLLQGLSLDLHSKGVVNGIADSSCHRHQGRFANPS